MVKNVLFFAPRLIYGGGEKVINWLADRLYNNQFNVYYATTNINSEYLSKLKIIGLDKKVRVVEFPTHIKKTHPYRYYRSVSNVLNDNHIDLIIYFGGSLIEQIAARNNGVKILLSERWSPSSRPILSKILKQIQYRIADAYVFQTPQAANWYCNHAKKVGVIIPNPILDNLPDPNFTSIRKEIVTAGRLSWEKNQILLIKAFEEIKNDFPEHKLIIYGSGPKEKELIEYIIKKKLDDRVFIVQGKRNIVELINGAELFVLPSDVEGMPNALIEAMAMGVLSISTDCPIYGPRMIIKDKINGFLTPLNDIKSLSSLMNYVLSNKSEQDKIRKESVKVRELLHAEKISNLWINYIKSL